MSGFVKDFKEFAMRGNALDMAIAVVIGGAFGKIITSLVTDIITPFISVLFNTSDLAEIGLVIGKASDGSDILLKYGAFLMSIIDFFLIVLCIFIALRVIMKFKRKQEEVVDEPVKADDIVLLEEIRDILKKK